MVHSPTRSPASNSEADEGYNSHSFWRSPPPPLPELEDQLHSLTVASSPDEPTTLAALPPEMMYAVLEQLARSENGGWLYLGRVPVVCSAWRELEAGAQELWADVLRQQFSLWAPALDADAPAPPAPNPEREAMTAQLVAIKIR